MDLKVEWGGILDELLQQRRLLLPVAAGKAS
jgi:hypothetical protein